MPLPITHTPSLTLDLVFERTIDIVPEAVWKAWTTPELIKQWFTPVPGKVLDQLLAMVKAAKGN